MTTIYQLLGAIYLAAALPFPVYAASVPKNESKIKVVGDSRKDRCFLHVNGNEVHKTNLIQKCQGAVPKEVNLAAVGLVSRDLEEGVSCIARDFDGNGYLDFLLYGPNRGPSGQFLRPRSSFILFFNGNSALRTQALVESSDLCPLDPTATERNNYPKYKDRTGFIKVAEGDAGCVYFYNPATGLFEQVPYVYSKDYEMGE